MSIIDVAAQGKLFLQPIFQTDPMHYKAYWSRSSKRNLTMEFTWNHHEECLLVLVSWSLHSWLSLSAFMTWGMFSKHDTSARGKEYYAKGHPLKKTWANITGSGFYANFSGSRHNYPLNPAVLQYVLGPREKHTAGALA